MKKYGILGGSFNPVHKGHISCAKLAKQKLNLDKLLFVPAYISPFKTYYETNVVSAHKRLEMLKLILTDKDEIIDYEILKKGVSYTLNTVKHILKVYGIDNTLFLIIGSDNYNLFHKWYKYKELLKYVQPAVIERPGIICKNDLVGNYIYLGKSEYNISSSEIRKRRKNKGDISKYVPKIIKDYIIKEKLYEDI